jgi:hypothetical protein
MIAHIELHKEDIPQHNDPENKSKSSRAALDQIISCHGLL